MKFTQAIYFWNMANFEAFFFTSVTFSRKWSCEICNKWPIIVKIIDKSNLDCLVVKPNSRLLGFQNQLSDRSLLPETVPSASNDSNDDAIDDETEDKFDQLAIISSSDFKSG